MENIWIIYGIINGITFFVYGIDKLKAVGNKYRIPERTLLILAVVGPIGGMLGMYGFRHKTRKPKFKILVPLFVVIHLLTFVYTVQVNGTEDTLSTWAVSEYNEAVNKGYITRDTSQGYQGDISRIDFVELLISSYEKLLGSIPDVTQEDNPFVDTASRAVTKAALIGVVEGNGGNLFYPKNKITRQEMIVMMIRLNRAIELRAETTLLTSFEEVVLPTIADQDEIADWALESVLIAYANQMTSGIGDNRFGPKNNTTVEQAVLINLRLMNKLENTESLKDYIQSVKAQEAINVTDNNGDALIGFITTQVLNMRSTPDLSSRENIINKLNYGEQVHLYELLGDWYRITDSTGLEGYIHKDYVMVYESAGDVSEQAAKIVDFARIYIGTPYLYGGTSLTSGTDCSNYTQKVYATIGIVLPRSSSAQYGVGTSVTQSELVAGDLLFYGYSQKVSHVAIYIGNGEAIHATTTGGVMVTPAFGWMNKPYIGAKRVIN